MTEMSFRLDTRWFEVAIVCAVTALGSIFLGHFEGAPRGGNA